MAKGGAGLPMADLITHAKSVIRQYSGGTRLTVRQIYYRLVAKQLIPNSTGSYRSVKEALVHARRGGLIPYQDIEDRTRAIHQPSGEDEYEPAAYFNAYYSHLKALDQKYDLPRWWGQPKKVMVLVEKQALSAIFQSVTDECGVDLVVCRGYPSLTLLWEISQRLEDADDYTEEFQLLYFGDFDPSGADIERATGDSLTDDFDLSFDIERVAITMDQIKLYNIPPAPAKTTDSRTAGFIADTGVAWQVELDAIEPVVLQGLIEDAIEGLFDDDIYDDIRQAELDIRRKKVKGWVRGALNTKFKPPKVV